MSAPEDELWKYLIVPSSQSPPSGQAADSVLSSEFRPDTPRFHKSASHKAEIDNMEIDDPARPNPFASAHANDDHVVVPLEGVMSLDDFLSAHQADHDAHVAASGTTQPAAKKPKTGINASPLQPVAVGARSSQYTILLHEKYQALAIPQPTFAFQGGGATGFSVTVSFPGLDNAEELQGLKAEGSFNSKQEAKEAASKTALEILERLVEEGRITKAVRGKKAKGEAAQQQQQQQQQLNEREVPGENYVGQLLEFQRATSGPQPYYTDYQLGTRWACLMEIEGHDHPFSSLDALFGSKKAARQHAAGCAVAHFKAQNLWPEEFTDVGGIRKRKSVPPTPQSDAHKASAASTPTASSGSATSQVAALAHLLNLSTPEYRFSYENPSVPDLHTVSCYFKNGGEHEGPIGEVRNVFGKKKAKEECARLALQYLSEVKKQREAVAERLITGIKGGARVVGVGVGMAMNGEESVAKRVAVKEVSDDEPDIYEDCVEY